MNSFDLYYAINDIDESFIVEANSNTVKHHFDKKYIWGAVAASFAILIAFSVSNHHSRIPETSSASSTNILTGSTSAQTTESENILIQSSSGTTSFFAAATNSTDSTSSTTEKGKSKADKTTTGAVNYVQPSWDKRVITSKFAEFNFNNSKYITVNSTKSIPVTLNVEKILCEETIFGTDNSTEKEYSIKATVYSIENISSDCFVALKFDGYDGFYPYINTSMKISNLNDLVEAGNLKSTMTVGNITYKEGTKEEKSYKFSNQSDIWKYLMFNEKAKNLGDMDITPYYTIQINISALGIYNKSLIVSDDGYIQTNIFETACTFYIGKEAVEEFESYISTLSAYTKINESNAGVTIPA